VYRIRAGQSQWILTRATRDTVMRVARKLSERYPTGQVFQIYRGERLVATTTKVDLFESCVETQVIASPVPPII
jgi:hypothetical protein